MMGLVGFEPTPFSETAHSVSSSFLCFCRMYKYENAKKLTAWGRSQARHDDGLQKANTNGFADPLGNDEFQELS